MMAMNLIKEEFHTTAVMCHKCKQTMVEQDLIVPDLKPDVKKVLEVSGYASITDKTIEQDKILLQGLVRMTVLYLPDCEDSACIQSLSTTREFTHTIDCRGASPEMYVLAEAKPESFDSTFINSRKLNLRCVLSLEAKVLQKAVQSFTVGLEDGENVAKLCTPLQLLHEILPVENRFILRERLEMPSGKPTIGEILRISATPILRELTIPEGKAVVKGDLRLCILYRSEEDTVEFCEHQLPFTEILDVEDALEDMEGEADLSLEDLYCEIAEDSDGLMRILSAEIALGIRVRCQEICHIEPICDAYATDGDLELHFAETPIEQLLDTQTAEITVKDQADVPSMLPDLRQVCDISSTAKIDRITAENGQITLFGTVQSSILYLTHDEKMPLCAFRHLTEFSHSFSVDAADGQTVCDARVQLEHTSFTLSGNQSVDLRFTLSLFLKALRLDTLSQIDGMHPIAAENQVPVACIVLYFVQPGDTLWKIAKRYHTTVEALKEQNHLTSDTIYPGQQMKILSLC